MGRRNHIPSIKDWPPSLVLVYNMASISIVDTLRLIASARYPASRHSLWKYLVLTLWVVSLACFVPFFLQVPGASKAESWAFTVRWSALSVVSVCIALIAFIRRARKSLASQGAITLEVSRAGLDCRVQTWRLLHTWSNVGEVIHSVSGLRFMFRNGQCLSIPRRAVSSQQAFEDFLGNVRQYRAGAMNPTSITPDPERVLKSSSAG
jgi:hypothetical protein